MPLISEDYRSLNERLHSSREDYGTRGKNWSGQIAEMAMAIGTRDILDYGCGKSTLAQNLPFKISQYDPAIKKFSERPKPADLVVCTDVLEHVEPENIDAVLDHLDTLMKVAGFFVIATRPAVKTLEDGRNAHLIQESYEWWMPKIWSRFTVIAFNNMGGEFMVGLEKTESRVIS